MKRPIVTLAALLALQLVLAGGLAAARVQRGAEGGPLLPFDAGSVDRVIVEGPNGARAEVARSGGAWTVPARGGFPADAAKVQRLLERLAAIRRAEPVATTAEAAARFHVADASFERRVVLEAKGKPVATALFGVPGGPRTVHARLPGSPAVQLAPFGAWEAPDAPDDWIDRTVLRIPRGEIEAIGTGAVTLERAAPAGEGSAAGSGTPAGKAAGGAAAWRASGLPPGASLDPKAAELLVSSVAELVISGVAEAQPAGTDAFAITVRRTGGKSVEYRFSKPGPAADWIVRSSTRKEPLRLETYVVEALRRAADPVSLAGKNAAAVPAPR